MGMMLAFIAVVVIFGIVGYYVLPSEPTGLAKQISSDQKDRDAEQ